MFTEYVFDKENDVAVRNLKATMFDIVANEEANMAKLQEKAASETDEDLRAKLVELLEAQSVCLRDVVRITNALVESMQQLDSYSKGLRELEQKSVEKKLAGMTNSQEPELNNVSERINSQVDEEVVSSDTIEQNADIQSPVEENVGFEIQEPQISDVAVSKDAVQGVEDSTDGVGSQTDEEVDSNTLESQMNDVSGMQVIQEDSVQQPEEIVDNSSIQTNAENNDVGVEETAEDVAPPIAIDSEVDSSVVPIVPTEETMTDTGLPPIPTIDDNVPIEENADSAVIDVPEISESASQPTAVVDNNSLELPVIEADGLNNSVGQVQESAVALPVVTFTRVGDVADRAILVTNKQSTNLRNSRDMQKQIVQIANSGVTESQLVDSGLLEPSTDDKKKKIEEMLENANSLYKQGNVQEAEVLYDEISKLNKELQGEEEKTLVA